MTGLVDGFRLSVGTLTSVPVSPPTLVDRRRGAIAMFLAPLAVLPLAGAVGVVVALGGAANLPVLVVAVAAVAVLALGNRWMHLDGLADTLDGLAAPYDRVRRLEIMRRGDVGAAGAAGLAITLLLQAAALAAVLGHDHAWLFAAVLVCASRAALTITCHRIVPAAREGGLAASVAGTVPTIATLALWSIVTVALCLGCTAADQPWWRGLVAAAAGIVATIIVVSRCRYRLGGITGDVCGASIELCLAAMLVAASAA